MSFTVKIILPSACSGDQVERNLRPSENQKAQSTDSSGFPPLSVKLDQAFEYP
jgi:hypothetical protein